MKFKQDFMLKIYQEIESFNEEHVCSWTPAFCHGIKHIELDFFSGSFLGKTLKLAGISQKGFQRIAASQIIIAATNVACEKNVLANEILQAYFELCQDAIPSIRKSALGNLKYLLQKIEATKVESIFFAELIIELKDPNPNIRHIAFDIILEHHKLISSKNLQNEVVPFLIEEFKEDCKDIENWLLQSSGKVVTFLMERGFMQTDLIPVIHKFYDRSFFSKDQDIRKACIKNLPAIIHMYYSNGTEVKYDIALNDLASNPIYQLELSESFYEVYI